jgi:PAS domain S-box-containing protein
MKPKEPVPAETQAAHAQSPSCPLLMAAPHAGNGSRDQPARNSVAAMIFSPAIALMNRLDITKKFMLLGLLSLVAIIVLIHSLVTNLGQVIRTSQRELEGIALIKSFSKTTQIVQQHGGLSAVELGGDKTLSYIRTAKEKEVTDTLRTMEAMLPPSLASIKDMQRIKANWERISKDGLNWTRDENLAAHSNLIDQMLLLEVAAADEYGLTLDPEIDTYYLINSSIKKLPNVIERLVRIREYGTGMLSEKRSTARQNGEMNTLLTELDRTLGELNINFEKIARHNPAVQKSILAVSHEITDSARQITTLVVADLITGHFTTRSTDFSGMSNVAIDKGYMQLYESLLPMLEDRIKARIAKTKNELITSVVIPFLLFLVVFYLLVAIWYAIIVNVQLLARSAKAFAGGDLRERINLGTRDEFSQMGDSFNEMADGFSTLIESRREEDARLRVTVKTSMDGFLVLDTKGHLLDVNDAYCQLIGYTREELLNMVIAELEEKETPEETAQHMQDIMTKGYVRFETRHRCKDGQLLDIAVSTVYQQDKEDGKFIVFLRNITERKETERKIQRLTQFYAALSQCNGAIVHCANEEELFQKICRAVVKFGGMKMAWIGLVDEASQRVNPVAFYGEGLAYLEEIEILVDGNDPAGRGPVGTAIREGELFWVQDFMNDPITAPWHERAASFGWNAMASLPLYRNGVVIGAFSLYSSEVNAFEEDARKLLTEMAMDISFALDNFAHEAERKQAEIQLRESETRYKRIAQGLTDYHYTVRVENGHAVDTQQSWSCSTVTGYAPEDFAADPYLWIQMVTPENRNKIREQVQQILAGKSVPPIEYRIIRKDGVVRWVSDTSILFKDASGSLLSYEGVIKDITERKTAEEQAQLYVAQLERAFMRTVGVATTLIEMRDPYTAGHERRVAEIAAAIGGELGWDARRVEGLRIAGQLHDIGKISTPAEILAKPGKITAAEYMLIKEHPQAGYDALKDVEFPWPVAEVAWQHHERMDGSGYPRGLKGDEILLEARIMSVADVVEAMASHRPYRPGNGIDKALEEIERGSGTTYDTTVAEACLRLFRKHGYTLPD